MMVIDSHVHIGSYPVLENLAQKLNTRADIASFRLRYPDLYERQTLEDPINNADSLLAVMDQHGVDVSVVMARPGVPNEFVAEMTRPHPDRLIPQLRLASDQQLKGYIDNPASVSRRCTEAIPRWIEEFGMRGVGEVFIRGLTSELHPERIADDLEPIMRRLDEYRIPISFPTGWSQWKGALYYGDPLWVDEIAGRYPEVPIVLCKMGRGSTTFFESSMMVALRNPNVHFDMTQTIPAHLRQAVDSIGAERIMFGTDWSASWRYLRAPEDVHTLGFRIIEEAGLLESEQRSVLAGTARNLFGL